MKRKVILLIFLFSIIFILPIVLADELSQVDDAYSCLESKTNTSAKCSILPFEDKLFSLLATGNCLNETRLDNLSNQCWPKASCKLKPTAQAILALNEEGFNTTKSEDWLLTQTNNPTEMDWFLEIESLSPTSCLINYSSPSSGVSSYAISIREDKKISTNAGNYLTLSQNNYWLKISPLIYNKDIVITCDKSFITTLLFKDKDISTIHVSETVHSSSANGRTIEKVDSFCFSLDKKDCDYEGSLWAAFVLYSLDRDVSKFMPYLITMANDDLNKKYLPETFLYFLTGEFKNELLSKQKLGLYWEESGDKYYDTALALWPLYYESPLEKEDSKEWLLINQQNTGCWDNGNIKNTAFLLYSIWPKSPPNVYAECSIDSDCPSISGEIASCDYGVCNYDYIDCINNDGYCNNPSCTIANDNDCEPGENVCDSNSDCEIYASEDDPYCSSDKTEVWKNVSDWKCRSDVCVEEEIPEKVETCSANEECYAGSCLSNGDIPEECTTYLDCAIGEDCIDSYCLPDEPLGCEEGEYGFCMSDVNCEGELLLDYSCTGVFSCCDTPIELETCSYEGGEICDSDQECIDGTIPDVSDTIFGEVCCVGGTCEDEIVSSFCVDNEGICKSSCGDGEEENSVYVCEGYGEVCCAEKEKPKSHIFVWILLGLILLSALGIVFRDKLRVQWLKFKTLFGKKEEKKKFDMPLPFHPNPQGRILPRRIFTPQSPAEVPVHKPFSPQSSTIKKKPKEKSNDELDEVLKKLKEIGK